MEQRQKKRFKYCIIPSPWNTVTKELKFSELISCGEQKFLLFCSPLGHIPLENKTWLNKKENEMKLCTPTFHLATKRNILRWYRMWALQALQIQIKLFSVVLGAVWLYSVHHWPDVNAGVKFQTLHRIRP